MDPRIYVMPALGSLLLATTLCGLVGLERQIRHKNAGIRTIALVGLGACLFTLTGRFGFVVHEAVAGDMTRIAAQVVSGVGFLGAGLIFVHRDSVRDLTTAASIWISAAIGVTCGAGLTYIALAGTLVYFILTFILPPLIRLLPKADPQRVVDIEYLEYPGTLRRLLLIASDLGFDAQIIASRRLNKEKPPLVNVSIRFTGRLHLTELAAELGATEGVEAIHIEDTPEIADAD